MFHDKSMHRNPIFFTQKEFYRYFQTKRLVPGLASAKETIYGKSGHFVYVRALIMCKSKDAVIASYHWAVLHTPVDTRAMYNMLAHYCHCLYLVLFATGEGRGKTAKRKTAKAIVSVFSSGSQGSHVWLAWLAWLARLARMARMARWLAHWPHSQ